MMVSRDLVNWRYVGDALPEPPSWAAEGSGLWAPDVVYSRTNNRYYLTFVVTNTEDEVSGAPGCTGDSAIGVATSRSPIGPWNVSEQPVVPPRKDPNNPDPCAFFWTFDPDVLGDSIRDRSILYYGSYYGGIAARRAIFTRRGIVTDPAETQIVIGNRYEGANVVKRRDWYYLFGSATNCCNGPLTGYSVFAGRSRSPLGPFVDREGNSLLAGRVGGTPVLSMNGNRWVGPGHNSVFRDFDGQWWTAYHAINRFNPYLDPSINLNRRPAMLDPLDWRRGWPTVRAGRWASDKRMPAPAAQPGEQSRYEPSWAPEYRPGRRIAWASDEFEGYSYGDQWSWVRRPANGASVWGGNFNFQAQKADLHTDSNNASVLVEDAPAGDYVVTTRVHLNLPPEGCCHNYTQAGLVIYGGDDRFIKLVHVSIWETRQTEFAKEVAPPQPEGYPRYGNTVVGPPSDWTYLRIVKRDAATGSDFYTAYTSQDGERWVKGGTWRHNLGANERIGLVSMGEPSDQEWQARFDYVRVARVRTVN
jgi:arabinan endo-1,5-alpha-L-arabinosidase